jgi:hypothetical protein
MARFKSFRLTLTAAIWLLGITLTSLASADVTRDLTNLTSLFSVAGTWIPVTDVVAGGGWISLSNANHSSILLPNGRYGLVLNGWALDNSDTTIPHKTCIVVLEQQADGTLSVATNKYITDPVTNGSNSVLVADLNGDGVPDIFLAAHNEAPLVPMSSTAYLSNSTGTYSKVELNDSVLAHGAAIYTYNGLPTVFTASFYPTPALIYDKNPYYQYTNGAFVEKQITYPYYPSGSGTISTQGNLSFDGESVAIASISGDGTSDMVISNLRHGPGLSPDPNTPPVPAIGIYKFSDIINNTGIPTIIAPYFNNKPQFATLSSGVNGVGQADTPRVWIDDFNHDGKPDIVNISSFYTGANYSILQLSQNTSSTGSTSFIDKTDTLNSGYSINAQMQDYDLQMIDIDGSGIKTYFAAGFLWVTSDDLQDNYILLNDGTGQMHVYMHDQFQVIGTQLQAYIAARSIPGCPYQPRFIAYLTPSNSINLVAECVGPVTVNGNSLLQHAFINVPLQLNPTVDYAENITVSDRNGSMLMRTWAGNDTFYDTNASSSPTSIDGGLGTNTSVYSGKFADYTIAQNADGTVTVKGNGLADRLKNIQRLVFSDVTIALPAPAIQIKQGWNLLGNGTNVTLNTPTFFGDSSKIATVWKWIPSKGNWAFYTPMQGDGGAAYATSKGYDLLSTINGGEGYWVNATAAFAALAPSGTAITSASFQTMPSGWNLIAIGDNQTPSQFNSLVSTTTALTTLWAWDASLANWYFYAPSLDSAGTLSSYIGSKGYLNFGTMTLSPTTGFWVNKP